MTNDPPTIVAEISRNWTGDFNGTCLAQKFELVIEHNRQRGYELADWRFTQTFIPAMPSLQKCLVETIIAVFKRKDPRG